MQHLIKQEQFEIEVLDRLNSRRLLKDLVFCDGTMLRLCYGLDRFSVDLDFWMVKKIHTVRLFNNTRECLGQFYKVSDAQRKYHTLLFEIKHKNYPRCLKIEIRREPKRVPTEQVIAYSQYASTQVLLTAVSLKGMMAAKIQAFVGRKEIRDAFDIEFLLKKGIPLPADSALLERVKETIDSLTNKDYTVKLGSLLEPAQRKYYVSENFKILKLALMR